ncbi:hypothetical protein RCXUPER_60 [Rhodobacter phage RcXuper]|nr:hypothetical protein RCXUPER_60 [Rhodobacter phage RcXuper]
MRWSLKPQQDRGKSEWLEKLYAEGKIKKKPESAQEPPPPIFPDLYWIWEAYCFLNERRGVGPNGPLPISVSDIQAYAELTGRIEPRYRQQLIRFIPPLDRVFLKDFYDRQNAEIEKARKKAEAASRRR